MDNIKRLVIPVNTQHAHTLDTLSRAVNQFWNDLNKINARSTDSALHSNIESLSLGIKEGLHYETCLYIAELYEIRRDRSKEDNTYWRRSYDSKGAERSRGWIPVSVRTAKWISSRMHYNGYGLDLCSNDDLSKYEIQQAKFIEGDDSLWYLSIAFYVRQKVLSVARSNRRRYVRKDARRYESRYSRKFRNRLKPHKAA